MSPGNTKAKKRGGGGSRKTAAKRPKADPSEQPESDADGIKVTPFEDADGFQIFRVAKPGAKKKQAASPPPPAETPADPPAATLGGKAEAASPPRDRAGAGGGAPQDSGLAAAAVAAGNGASAGNAIGQWMAETIESIVREEMRLAVDRITKSVIRETGTEGASDR